MLGREVPVAGRMPLAGNGRMLRCKVVDADLHLMSTADTAPRRPVSPGSVANGGLPFVAMVKPPHADPVAVGDVAGAQVTVLGWVPLRRHIRVRLAEGLAASRRVQQERGVGHAADIGCKVRARYSPGMSAGARNTEGFLRRECLDGVVSGRTARLWPCPVLPRPVGVKP